MKNIYLQRLCFLSLSFLLICASSQATNYYISTTGSNSNNGLSAATPWQTIAKLNSSFSTFKAGDSILFKSGQVFTGSIMVNKSGTATSPIVISSYGTGAKPIISGLTTLTGWTNVSGNIWQSSVSTLKDNVNVLTINGVPQAVGRTDWMVYQSATSSQLTSSSLTGTPSYVGAEIVMRKGVFVAERATITAQSGSTVTYTGNNVPGIHNGRSASLSAGRAKYGFFLQRFAGSLDKQGEWYYNPSTDKMMIYSTTNPSNYTIKASNVDTLINLNKQTNITIANLSLEGAGIYAIESYGGTNVTIKNCSFDNNTKAIYVWNTNDITIDNNTINNSFNNAILVSNNQTKRINVTNNTVTNTGQLMGMGVFNHEYSLRGIVARTDTTRASNYINIIGNKVINSGNAAIQFQGSNAIIRRNITDTFCNQIDDNGGIYTFINNSSVNNLFYTNRVVDSNFISNAIGAPVSANGGVDVTGLYFDDQTNNIIARHNTIWNIPGNGIQLNNPLNMTITDNTVYNCSYLVWINKKPYGDIKGTSITKNVLYQKDATQYNYGYTNYNLSSPKMTVTQAFSLVDIDSNWISNLQTTGYYYYYSTTGSGYTFPPKLTLSQWRNTFGNSVNSVLSPKATPTNTKIEFNPSNKAKTVSFNGQSYIDAKGTVYNNSATIPAWGNLVLISNGTAAVANTPPVATAPANQSITLPVNTVTLEGYGTDKEGAISSYSWSKISGPSAGTIESVNAATTVISALTEGTYKFELSVKDSKGLIGKDTTTVTVKKANTPPVAEAPANTSITLPVNTVTLSGTGTDEEGAISSYSWAKISGPSAYTIESVNAATTVISSLAQGTYKFELSVKDSEGLIGKDTITVTVNKANANTPPVAQAPANQSITLPVNTVTLAGQGTAEEGAISSYSWRKLSGPSAGTIESVNAATTVISALTEGTYKFELSVIDSKGLTAKDTTIVTVNPADNKPPHAQGNKDTTITLPTSSILLSGVNSSDADGTIASYAWTKISGPSGSAFGTPNSSVTTFENLVEGSYTVDLMVTDDKGTIDHDQINIQVLAANKPPHAQGNKDTTITLPINSILLSGVNSSDADGTIASYAWTKISGPSGSAFGTPNSSVTTFENLVEGSYTVDLMVTDDKGTIDHDQINIQVLAANKPPHAQGNKDTTITLPINSILLSGVNSSDADGTIASYAWTKISGPSGSAFGTPNSSVTTFENLVEGSYTVDLMVTDDKGTIDHDQINIQVLAANKPPHAQGNKDTTITLPINSMLLSGVNSSDADGTITSFTWTKISGPSGSAFGTPNSSVTTFENLVEGYYTVDLMVTDDKGTIDHDQINIRVLRLHIAPIVNAGEDIAINLPTNKTTLAATVIVDGTVSSYAWTKISGPSAGTIESVNATTTVISGLVEGIYKFELSVKDSEGLTGKDTTVVTVIKANTPPVSHAPANLSITLPVNKVTLEGYGTDDEGSISSSSWRKTAGPSAYTIESANTGTTVISGLVEGVYTFELSVTDSEGLIGKDWTVVTVIKANTPPVAQAPANQSITLPVNTVTLAGTGTDEEGPISSYYWSKISGPSAGTIESVNAATTVISGLVEGIYKFELSVKDSEGLTGKDTTVVTVIKANTPPVSHAPANLSITLPVNKVTLEGYGTDDEGSISSSSWRKTAGPSAYTIESANTGTTVISGLVEGVYTFELSVTDSEGLIGKDWTVVTVIKANTPPVSHAPANQSITLPVNTVTLAGTGTDEEGPISSYSWSKISGPSAGTIESVNAATTVISGLVEGIYKFELSVKDSKGLTGKDTTVVTVIKANTPPVSHAPANLSITLPLNKVTLAGYGTDGEGPISSSSWRKTAGPSAYTIESANTGTTVISGLVEGVYKFELSVTDSEGLIGKDWTVVTVIKANTPPVSHAPANLSITLPVNKVTLAGYGTDEEGPISSYSWSKIAGPSAYKIESANTGTTVISGLVEGVYKFELSVTDSEGLIGKDWTVVTVIKANTPPVSHAPANLSITLPVNKVTLAGYGTDDEGSISSSSWRKTAGPSAYSIESANTGTTVISGLVEGVYTFELSVTDSEGLIGKDWTVVTVIKANTPPVSHAPANLSITLPVNKVTLAGYGTDDEGPISSSSWRKTAGPSAYTIESANTGTTVISGLVEGVYKFELSVTDSEGLIGKDWTVVTVIKANTPPVSHAPANLSITLPVNKVTLAGYGTDDEGPISSSSWRKIAGPSAYKIQSPNTGTTVISGLVQGTYKFELSVTDSEGLVGKDITVVTVNKALQARSGSNLASEATNENTLVNESVNNEAIVKDTVQATTNEAGAANHKPTPSLVKAYPNPVKSVTNLDITTVGRSVLTISVIDISGKVVKYNQGINIDKKGTIKLDMSSLRDGYYIITVRFNNGELISTRVIKQGGR